MAAKGGGKRRPAVICNPVTEEPEEPGKVWVCLMGTFEKSAPHTWPEAYRQYSVPVGTTDSSLPGNILTTPAWPNYPQYVLALPVQLDVSKISKKWGSYHLKTEQVARLLAICVQKDQVYRSSNPTTLVLRMREIMVSRVCCMVCSVTDHDF